MTQDKLRHTLLAARANLEGRLAVADEPAQQAALAKELRSLKLVMDRLIDRHIGAASASCDRIIEKLAV